MMINFMFIFQEDYSPILWKSIPSFVIFFILKNVTIHIYFQDSHSMNELAFRLNL